MSFNLNDYIDVKSRVALFYAKYPEGSLSFTFKGVCPHDDNFVWGVAYAHRTPDDLAPGVGTAQEAAIGRTNFTKGSVIQNLESSCWGRAIASLGLGIDNSVASRDEVEAAQSQDEAPKPVHKGMVTSAPASEKQLETITKMMPSAEWVADWKTDHGITGKLNKAEASDLIADLINLKMGNKND